MHFYRTHLQFHLNMHVLFCRAFDVHKRRMLSYRDILLGLAAMEPATQHGGTPAEMRCRYIFRYYDKEGEGLLEFSEFK